MQRLLAKVREIEEANRQSAQTGCLMADLLEKDLTPERLSKAQNSIRPMLLLVQRQRREFEARRLKRQPRIKRLLARNPDLGKRWGEHQRLLQAREEALKVAEAIQRQIGDAFAWLVLRQDPRIIAPLAAERTHHLPDQVGLSGPVLLANAAHESGKFLVVDNDLTRCLGIGDLTVVSANGQWLRPISLEIKSSLPGKKFELGAHVDSEVITSVSDHPVDAALWEEFRSTLGLSDQRGDNRRPSSKSEVQAKEILERSQLLMEVTGRIRERMPAPKNSLWPGIETVLLEAMTRGSHSELIDEGIMAVGLRIRGGEDPEAELSRILTELEKQGFAGRDRNLVEATNIDFREQDSLSPFVPPMPLWPLPLDLRSALLSGELFYACVYDPVVWDRAMANVGVALSRDDGHWTLNKGTETAHLDPIEVMKLTFGVLFAGLRPSEIASSMADALSARLRAQDSTSNPA